MITHRTAILSAALAVLLAHGGAGHADGTAQPRDKDNLPGVDRSAGEGANIERPDPARADPPEPDGKGFVAYGNWNVRISGDVTIDVGAGNVRPPDW